MRSAEYKKISKQAIESLEARDDVDWFVDANVIISGDARRLFNDYSRLVVTNEVAEEVRKRPESVAANEFLDRLVKQGSIWSNELLDDGGESFGLILDCAKSLAPAIRVRKQQLVEDEGLTAEQAEVRAIEMVANEGWFFECELKQDAVKQGLMTKEEAKLDKASRRAWFKYPNKRRQRDPSDYKFSDEIMIGTSVANALLNGRKTCVLSNDTDCAAIMKQFADNILWVASAMDCELSLGRVDLEPVVQLWENRCQDLNRYRQHCEATRMMKMIELGEPDVAKAYEPIKNEVIICRTNDSHVSNFAFNDPFEEFVRNYDFLQRRCRLVKQGFWFPKPIMT